ncbi:MAG: hypothetical protein JRJ62_00095 [Deltaproteobacteria bacterium]|nr:hypothetical protein [Deltaproteobacteria bacterium]
MATLEEISLILDSISNINGLRKDVRRNAEGYMQSLANGQTYLEVDAIIREDLVQYTRRLDWQKVIFLSGANSTKLGNGAAALGLTNADLIAAHNEVRTVVDFLDSQPAATSDASIESAKNYILNNIAQYVTVWD